MREIPDTVLFEYLEGVLEPGRRQELETQLGRDPRLQGRLSLLRRRRQRLIEAYTAVDRIDLSALEGALPGRRRRHPTARLLALPLGLAALALLLIWRGGLGRSPVGLADSATATPACATACATPQASAPAATPDATVAPEVTPAATPYATVAPEATSTPSPEPTPDLSKITPTPPSITIALLPTPSADRAEAVRKAGLTGLPGVKLLATIGELTQLGPHPVAYRSAVGLAIHDMIVADAEQQSQVSLINNPPQPLPCTLDEDGMVPSAAWNASRRFLLVSCPSNGVETMLLADLQSGHVYQLPATYVNVSFSPDGRLLLLLISDEAQRFSTLVYVVDMASLTPRLLLEGAPIQLGVTWSPDSSRIMLRGNEHFLAAGAVDGSAFRALNFDKAMVDFWWSRDGSGVGNIWWAADSRTVTLEHTRPGVNEVIYESYSLDFEQGQMRSAPPPQFFPSWLNVFLSPDGRWYIGGERFPQNPFDSSVLYRADGEAVRALLPEGLQLYDLAWLPDSSGLIVTAGRTAGDLQVLRLPLDGEPVPLARYGEEFAGYLDDSLMLSADGERVVVGVRYDMIVTLSADGSELSRFTGHLQEEWP